MGKNKKEEKKNENENEKEDDDDQQEQQEQEEEEEEQAWHSHSTNTYKYDRVCRWIRLYNDSRSRWVVEHTVPRDDMDLAPVDKDVRCILSRDDDPLSSSPGRAPPVHPRRTVSIPTTTYCHRITE